MPTWKFWKRRPNGDPTSHAGTPPPSIAPNARGFAAPDPRQDLTGLVRATENPAMAKLLRQRDAILAGVAQAQLAAQSGNPWNDRAGTIDVALATIAVELERLDAPVFPGNWPIPPLPITLLQVQSDPQAMVTFRLGEQEHHYEAEIDWAERGSTVYHGDLTGGAVDFASLLHQVAGQSDAPFLAEDLQRIPFVFATACQEAAERGDELPAASTLRDISSPCPVCGRWRDMHGICLTCEERNRKRACLLAEQERLRGQRQAALDERDRLRDHLPIAQRRLAEIDMQIAGID